jgi:hypothetical protein
LGSFEAGMAQTLASRLPLLVGALAAALGVVVAAVGCRSRSIRRP